MNIKTRLFHYRHKACIVTITVPDGKSLQFQYENLRTKHPDMEVPYWGQIWPAAIGLSDFIIENSSLLKDKIVLELAAGIGLPSVVAARFARQVICSDYEQDAVDFAQQNIQLNECSNIQARVIDWRQLPKDLDFDTVLMSDVNYEPESFFELKNLFEILISRHKTIVLATPQRLMAKPFINDILSMVKRQEELEVIAPEGNKEYISVYVL